MFINQINVGNDKGNDPLLNKMNKIDQQNDKLREGIRSGYESLNIAMNIGENLEDQTKIMQGSKEKVIF